MSAGKSIAAQLQVVPEPQPEAHALIGALNKFHVGVNLPWMRYGCDFGANAWHPHGGISQRENYSKLAKVLSAIRARDVLVMRWFLLCDGRAGIRFAPDGTPVGLDDRVFPDLDAALHLIHEHGLRVVFVLFDFHWCKPRRVVKDVPLGGHLRALQNSKQRDSLLNNVVDPILARYGRHPAIAAWDVMNEPEQATFRLGSWSPLRSLSQPTMRSFLLQTVAHIHGQTRHAATVGLASLRGLPLCREIGVDFYQVHWYDKLEPRSPLATDIPSLGLDRPVVLGEFPTVNSRHSVGEILRVARTAGYAGAWCWSVMADDKFTAGSLPILRV